MVSIILKINVHIKFICLYDKKQLKCTGASITKNLTADRMLQLKHARIQFGVNMWSIDRRIMYKDSPCAKPKLFYG